MKLMTKTIERAIEKYPLYSQDGKGMDAKVVVKFFNPCGSQTWYVTEGTKIPYDSSGDYTFFGYATGFDYEGEWGYFNLSQLAELRVGPNGLLGIERDMYYKPCSKTVKEMIQC